MRKLFSVKGWGMAMLCLMVAVGAALQSCDNKKAADVSDLLSTVPSSAATVVGFDLRNMLEKAGCKVDGTTITPGKEVEALINAENGVNDSNRETLRMLLSGESGIDPVGAIYFADAYNSYVTAVVADTEKFTAFVEKLQNGSFEDAESNVKTNGNIALSGAQMWVCVSSNNTIDAKAVKNYAGLQESQSFLSSDFAPAIAKMTHDIVGYSQLKGFTKGMSLSNAATMNLVSGLLFDNASALSFNVDFLNGKATAQAILLNDKGQTAKYLLPADKIDVEKVKGLATTANLVGAMSITKDLIKKIEKMGESLGGNMLSSVTGPLSSLDGTAAIALSNLENPGEGVSAIVTTDGNPSLDLMQMLSQFGGTQKDGKNVKVVNGTVSGQLSVDDAAEFLKGSTFGFVVYADGAGVTGSKLGMKSVGLNLASEKGGVALNVCATTTSESENSLLTIIRMASAD